MKITQNITLDFARSTMPIVLFAKQYDKDTREIVITPLNNGTAYSLEAGITARIQMTKPDGTTVINNASIANNVITVTLTAQALAAEGTAVAEIGLYKGETLLSSQIFYIDIQKGAYDEDAPKSSDEYNSLVDALARTETAERTANSAINAANQALVNARAAVANVEAALVRIDGKVDKTQKIAGLALRGDIDKVNLYDAMASTINPRQIVPGTTPGYMGQYGVTGDAVAKPVFNESGVPGGWIELALAMDIPDAYTKEEIDNMIGDIESLLAQV